MDYISFTFLQELRWRHDTTIENSNMKINKLNFNTRDNGGYYPV
jgi:hypothetical protein